MPKERNWAWKETQLLYTEPDLESWDGMVADLRRDDNVGTADQFCFPLSGDSHETTRAEGNTLIAL